MRAGRVFLIREIFLESCEDEDGYARFWISLGGDKFVYCDGRSRLTPYTLGSSSGLESNLRFEEIGSPEGDPAVR